MNMLQIKGAPQWYAVQEGDATMLAIAVFLPGQSLIFIIL
jgi:hypothetical protein